MDIRKLDFILSELAAYSGVKKQVGETTFVACPYHSERTPSFRVYHKASSQHPGFGRCFGCGAAHPWDEYAPKLGLKAYTYAKPSQQFARSVVKPLVDDMPATFQHQPLPKNKVWRTIKTNLLIDIGCTLIKPYDETFIFMPVTIKGEERGYIRARLKKVDDKPSYLNKSGRWSEQFGLFLYDYSVALMKKLGWSTIVLVEGPRDALRLVSLGIPAMAILGTQSWSKRKATMMELTGAKNVILCFDGDCAGLSAEELVTPSLSKLVKVHTFDLRGSDSPYWKFRNKEEPSKCAKKAGVSLWDPGNMPLRKVRELKQLIASL
jgi:5S rRNA maturation endonuclease (ribonuclease M5)